MLFQEELQSITELLNQGTGTSLSEIRDTINLKQGENVVTNKEVKLLLAEFLSDKIQICKFVSSKSIDYSFSIKLECRTRYVETSIN